MATTAWLLASALLSAAHGQTPCVRMTQIVQDQQSGIRLPDARVSATWRDAGGGQLAMATDSSGTAVLCVPANTAVVLRIEYDGRVRTREAVYMQPPTPHTVSIDAPSALVRGRVVDERSGAGISQAVVRVARSRTQAITDANGGFVFERLPSGKHGLVIEHIAYAGHTVPLEIRDADLDAVIRMSPAAIPLEPIVVTVFSRRLEAVGFYERRKRGIGTFIDRKRVDQMNVNDAADLLRHIPGVRLVPVSRTRANQPRTATLGARGNCRYVFIVDGSRTLSDFEMDYIAGSAIEGVEVYSGADVPAAFKAHASSVSGSAICGVIAMWTRNSR